jgi:hypothetical protein
LLDWVAPSGVIAEFAGVVLAALVASGFVFAVGETSRATGVAAAKSASGSIVAGPLVEGFVAAAIGVAGAGSALAATGAEPVSGIADGNLSIPVGTIPSIAAGVDSAGATGASAAAVTGTIAGSGPVAGAIGTGCGVAAADSAGVATSTAVSADICAGCALSSQTDSSVAGAGA